jgi:uncharacterized protein (DUF302 family)
MDLEAPRGLATLPSAHPAAETAARLEALLAERGVRLFARIDHAEGASEAGLPLRPTLVLVFGDPRAGTPLMQSRQTAGIDLPLKMLVWEDEAGRCWVSYDRPEYVAERHGITDRAEAVAKIAAGLDALAHAAAAP